MLGNLPGPTEAPRPDPLALERAFARAERELLAWPHVAGVGPDARRGVLRVLLACEGPDLPPSVPSAAADGTPVRVRVETSFAGRIEPACAGGSRLTRTGEFGTLTLLFRNRPQAGGDEFLGITCGHVVGDLTRVRPVSPWVWSHCCPAVHPLGETEASTTRLGAFLEYDVALVKLHGNAATSCTLGDRTTRRGIRLRSFLPSRQIGVGTHLQCEFQVSNVPSTTVVAPRTTVYMDLPGARIAVRNALTIGARVLPGDSGGLLHQRDRAAGILFGRSPDGRGWFHPLEDALRYLAGVPGGRPFRVFP